MPGKTLHWCRHYFTKDSDSGKFVWEFCGEKYAENVTRMENHILVNSISIFQNLITLFLKFVQEIGLESRKEINKLAGNSIGK